MLERIQKHVEERDAIVKELRTIMGYCDESPIVIDLISQWEIMGDELHLQVEGESLEDNSYSYIISSMSGRGEQFFIGIKDGITYVMAYSDNTDDTMIFVLDNKNQPL